MSLKFSVSLPVLNAARYLERCLRSIRCQNYPEDLVEILVADGGSQDDTVKIAKEYGARIFENPRQLADYGAKISVRNATGDLLVVFAADNELVGDQWLAQVAAFFDEDDKLAVLWGRQISGPDDSSINRYYELIQSDPLSFYLNKNLVSYVKAGAETRRIDGVDGHIFDVDPRRPLVWGANGLTYRLELVKDIILRDEFLGDNDVFQILIEEGHNRVAYLPKLHICHHHVQGIDQWLAKWRRNFGSHFLAHRASRNLNWILEPGIRKRLLGWIVYSLCPLFSGGHACLLAARDRTIYWMYHPILSFLQTAVYGYLTLSTSEGRRLLGDLLTGGK